MTGVRALGSRVLRALPGSIPLRPDVWEGRHRWIVALLWAQCVPLIVGSIVVGSGLAHSLAELLPVPALAYLASRPWVARSMRACIAALGLMVSAAMIVHLSGGRTEFHFYFFVLLGVIALYQDWRPFLMSIAFVALHHAVVGLLAPESVFDNPDVIAAPIPWTGVHVLFVAAMSAVAVTSWRIVEDTNRAAADEIAAGDRRFQAMIEHSTDAVLLSDGESNLLYSSPAWNRMLGHPADAVVEGWDLIHPDDLAISTAQFEGVLEGGRSDAVEIRIRHRDGSYRWIEVAATNLLDEGAVGAIVCNCRDVTERRQLEDELAHQAFHDSLTGLANRALLLDRVEMALDRARSRTGHRLALLYLDLDDFKTVNDGLGHEAGDAILVATAERIREVLRAGDTAARLGGDEFAVLLEDLAADPEVAYEIGGRVLEAVCTPFDIDGTLIAVHASLGIVVSDGQEDAASLMRNADLAMYRAKGDGKGRFEIYEAGMHAAVVERMARKADLRRAVDAQEFEPHYQPIMDLESGAVAGVEALARWRHPERGIVFPGDFIPLAEETGLIVPIGTHILRRACADAARWVADLGVDAPSSIAVNLSARQLHDAAIVDEVANALRDASLDPGRLTLEITESALLADTESTARTLAALKALGVRLALDDFGTGFSSLSHLDRFPVDIVKIDKSFVDSLADVSGTPSPLVGAILRLGAALGVDVTAEGIEYPGQLATLRSLGCRSGQGFFFAEPMPAAAIRQVLEAGVRAVSAS